MGQLHDIMNANGLYTESDVKELKDRCKTLWKALVELKCCIDVEADTILRFNDSLERKTEIPERAHPIIRNSAQNLIRSANVATYIIRSYNRWDT